MHLRAFREPVAETRVVEPALGVMAQVHGATAHPRTDPAARIAEDDRPPAGHVLEGEPAEIPAEHHLGAGEADRRARVGAALDEEAPALSAVAEALSDRTVHVAARFVPRLQDRDCSTERGLGGAVLRATPQGQRDPVGRVRGEAVAGDRTFAERLRDLGGRRARDP